MSKIPIRSTNIMPPDTPPRKNPYKQQISLDNIETLLPSNPNPNLLNDAEMVRAQLNSLRNSIKSVEEEIEGFNLEIWTYKTEIQQADLGNQDLENTFNELSRKIKLEMNEFEKIQDEKCMWGEESRNELNLRIKEIEVEAEQSLSRMSTYYNNQIEHIKQLKLQESQTKIDSLNDQIQKYETDILENPSKLGLMIKELETNYSNEENKIRQHMKEIRTSLGEELISLKDSMKDQQKKFTDIQEKLKKQESEKNNKQNELDELRSSKAFHDTESLSLQQEIEKQKTKILEKQRMIKNLKHQMEWKEKETINLKTKLIDEELFRRKLHNKMQDLKGNIRVFCRVRPPLNNESIEDLLDIRVPDNEEEEQVIEIKNPVINAPVNVFTKNLSSSFSKQQVYKFDRVFQMNSSNGEIFEEISQLSQSALDGFNVCVFAYGQTGSGKTHTMSSVDGMIPRVIEQIFESSKKLKERGWHHRICAEFLEIYNENINDLLGDAQNIDKLKYEIRHDSNTRKTTVTGITNVEVEYPEMMNSLFEKALRNRSIAATKANERSSRSHTVFTIRIFGENSKTNENVEGILNLIDLAGSERLTHSQATGDRLKETQNINKSLSCLGDVIYALNDTKTRTHIPFRNSKLTYLLQYSLSGNSKTLMFVNISPFTKYFNETLNSLRFATKVNSTKFKS